MLEKVYDLLDFFDRFIDTSDIAEHHAQIVISHQASTTATELHRSTSTAQATHHEQEQTCDHKQRQQQHSVSRQETRPVGILVIMVAGIQQIGELLMGRFVDKAFVSYKSCFSELVT